MGKTFNQKVLGDIAYLVRESYVPKDGNKIPYIGLEHIGQGTLTLDSFGWSTEVTSIKSRFSKGDILFGKLRPYFRKVIQAPFDGICSTDIWVVRAKEGINQRFLYYLMASQDFIDYVTQGSDGTKMPRANWSYASQFSFDIPSYTVQSQIGNILGSLDDKIALNNRMNLTLEEMARTIFKSWFVDFDPVRARAEGRDPGLPAEIADLFPDSFEDSPLGEIPRGWRVVPILEIAALLSGGTPKTSVPEYWDGNVYWVTAKDVSQKRSLYIIDTDKKITELGLENSSAKILPKNTVIVTARGTVGAYALLGKEMAMNQTNYGLVSQRENEEYFLFFMVVSILDELKRNAYGTIFDTITTRTFQNVKVLMPPTKLTRCFNDLVYPFFEKMLNNENENASLIELRDKLLPGLMNGSVHLRGD